MRKIWLTALFLGFVVSIAAFPGFAQMNGAGMGEQGTCVQQINVQGTTMGTSCVCSGTPFTVSGTVASMVPGEGMELAVEGGTVQIYGIGPVRYWDALGVDRPGVGEEITVEGYTVDLNGIVRNVATEITLIDGTTVPLRDETTCLPLWRHFK